MMGGGTMGGTGGMKGGMMGMNGRAVWAINGASMTGDGASDMPPVLTFQRGRSVVLLPSQSNRVASPDAPCTVTAFAVLTRNGAPVPIENGATRSFWRRGMSCEIAFVADNPGDWMLHCHVMDHQVSGLMTVLRVA